MQRAHLLQTNYRALCFSFHSFSFSLSYVFFVFNSVFTFRSFFFFFWKYPREWTMIFRHSFKCNATTWPAQAIYGIAAHRTRCLCDHNIERNRLWIIYLLKLLAHYSYMNHFTVTTTDDDKWCWGWWCESKMPLLSVQNCNCTTKCWRKGYRA